MQKRVLALKDSVASGNLDRGNGSSTLRRVSSCTAASRKIRSFIGFICAALSVHLRRSIFTTAHRRLGTKDRNLTSGVQQRQESVQHNLYTCAESSNHLRRIVTYTNASEHLYTSTEQQRASIFHASQLRRVNCAKAPVYLLGSSCDPTEHLECSSTGYSRHLLSCVWYLSSMDGEEAQYSRDS
jgi:hypothetical protein